MDEDKSQLKDALSAPKDGPPSPAESPSSPQDELKQVKQELQEHKDKYLRLLADMENARKRMQKEKHDATRFAIENVIREFLMPLDNFENAMGFVSQTSEETQNWAKGFKMILTQFKDILASHQVKPFESKGVLFDPHLHEVIEVEETEKYQAGTILQEFLRGYKCGDRILRPARVKVAKNASDNHSPLESCDKEQSNSHSNQEEEGENS